LKNHCITIKKHVTNKITSTVYPVLKTSQKLSNSADKLTNQQRHQHTANKPVCGPMPNVMAALPNIGGALLFNAAKFG